MPTIRRTVISLRTEPLRRDNPVLQKVKQPMRTDTARGKARTVKGRCCKDGRRPSSRLSDGLLASLPSCSCLLLLAPHHINSTNLTRIKMGDKQQRRESVSERERSSSLLSSFSPSHWPLVPMRPPQPTSVLLLHMTATFVSFKSKFRCCKQRGKRWFATWHAR